MSKKKYSEDSDCLILGNPGTGKTLTAKRDILDAFNNTKDEIIICDPEGEFYPFVNELGGQVIKISPTSPCHVNPMDISLIYPDYSYPDNSADDDPMTLKANFFLSLCELAVGGRNGLTFEERSLINFCVRNVYVDHFKNPVPENMPILEDLYNLLRGYAEKDEAQTI